MTDCIFCKIASHDIDAHTVYEDEKTIAFLDANPVSKGHMLVISKEHEKEITSLGDEATAALFSTVRKMAEGIQSELDPDGINILQNNGEEAGQEVGHVHVHVIPRYDDDGLDIEFDGDELDEDEAYQLVNMFG